MNKTLDNSELHVMCKALYNTVSDHCDGVSELLVQDIVACLGTALVQALLMDLGMTMSKNKRGEYVLIVMTVNNDREYITDKIRLLYNQLTKMYRSQNKKKL